MDGVNGGPGGRGAEYDVLQDMVSSCPSNTVDWLLTVTVGCESVVTNRSIKLTTYLHVQAYVNC